MFAKIAILKRIKRKNRGKGKVDRMEWALVSKSNPKKILRWFGTEKPSHERLIKEERRIHSFGSTNITLYKGDNMIKDLIVLANHLDEIGLNTEADLLEEVIKEAAAKEKKKPSKKQLKAFDTDKDGKPFEEEDFKLLREKKQKKKASDESLVGELIRFANHLDSIGLVKEANIIDSLIKESGQKANVIGDYMIQKGDTLTSITKEHSPGRTIEENAKLNDMGVNDTLVVGKVIKIWTTPEYEGYAG